MKSIATLLTFILTLNTFSFDVFSQSAAEIVDHLPLEKWSGDYKKNQFTKEEKEAFLETHPRDTNYRFIMDAYTDEEDEAPAYWPHTYDDLYFLDLDFDGDLDMLFSGVSGNMNQKSTKIYFNNGKALIFDHTFKDAVLDIKKEKDYYRIFTLFKPCCDSYTNRISEYQFSAKDTLKFIESVSVIGRIHQPFKGVPIYSTTKTQTIKSPSILVLPSDFKGVSGYFRDRNKEIKAKLKIKEVIEFLKIEGDVKIQLITNTDFRNTNYSLVITEPLNNLPKMPESLYEWSSHNGSRIVGWIKTSDL